MSEVNIFKWWFFLFFKLDVIQAYLNIVTVPEASIFLYDLLLFLLWRVNSLGLKMGFRSEITFSYTLGVNWSGFGWRWRKFICSLDPIDVFHGEWKVGWLYLRLVEVGKLQYCAKIFKYCINFTNLREVWTIYMNILNQLIAQFVFWFLQ